MKIKRICIYGAPGSGKTTLAHELFVHYKKQGKSVQFINELATNWALIDRPIIGSDQIYLFASQTHAEDTIINRNKADIIITESPIFQSLYYTQISKMPEYVEPLIQLATIFENRHPGEHYFCHPNDKFIIHSSGRYHNQTEAKSISTPMLDFLKPLVKLQELPNDNRLDFIISQTKHT